MEDTRKVIIAILDEVLSLGGRSATFTRETHLLGAVPEFDSMAVVALISALEEQIGIVIDDDEIEGTTFSTVGSLVDFVTGKLATTSRT
jgi:acyl carrier protein